MLTISILLSCIMMRAHNRKANMSLCFSNKLRHTLLYRLKVKNSLMLTILLSTVSVRHMSGKGQWKQHDFSICTATILCVECLSTCSLRVGNASHEDAEEPLQ